MYLRPIGNGSWLLERGVEIISEAIRHLTDELKARHPEFPRQKVAGIGNVQRHNTKAHRCARHMESWHIFYLPLPEKSAGEELAAEFVRQQRG